MGLGPRFVSLIYLNAITSRHSFCLVAEVEGRVEGFILGSFDSRRWWRDFVLRQGPKAFFYLLPKVFQPRHLSAVWRGATYFPEANGLVAMESFAEGSRTPAYKSVVITLEPRTS